MGMLGVSCEELMRLDLVDSTYICLRVLLLGSVLSPPNDRSSVNIDMFSSAIIIFNGFFQYCSLKVRQPVGPPEDAVNLGFGNSKAVMMESWIPGNLSRPI